MPVRRAECAWAPCELLTPRQYVYVKIANRCMVPWCTQGASTVKDLPRTGALKFLSGSRFRASEAARVLVESARFARRSTGSVTGSGPAKAGLCGSPTGMNGY